MIKNTPCSKFSTAGRGSEPGVRRPTVGANTPDENSQSKMSKRAYNTRGHCFDYFYCFLLTQQFLDLHSKAGRGAAVEAVNMDEGDVLEIEEDALGALDPEIAKRLRRKTFKKATPASVAVLISHILTIVRCLGLAGKNLFGDYSDVSGKVHLFVLPTTTYTTTSTSSPTTMCFSSFCLFLFFFIFYLTISTHCNDSSGHGR
jgi:hypothetical protein